MIIFLTGNITYGYAQELVEAAVTDSTFVIITDTIPVVDSIPESGIDEIALSDSTVQEAFQVADVAGEDNLAMRNRLENTFKPNSTRAVLYSAIFPGLGQIYNRQYWKLPLVYGGFTGFMYAITWNNRMYQDYSNAYVAIVHDAREYPEGPADKWSTDWTDLVRSGDYQSVLNNTSYHDQFKRRKDYYRRYRDLSIILAVGFYALCMLDAYVDAEMFDFDVSPDLSMRVEPLIMPRTGLNEWTFGINYSITF
ncbi:MAG: DUF5683 domain-containing protein [Tannerellaceae bacterium]|nr:DUF5683 domain-containing protein [Tannerellaceae bacterium]